MLYNQSSKRLKPLSLRTSYPPPFLDCLAHGCVGWDGPRWLKKGGPDFNSENGGYWHKYAPVLFILLMYCTGYSRYAKMKISLAFYTNTHTPLAATGWYFSSLPLRHKCLAPVSPKRSHQAESLEITGSIVAWMSLCNVGLSSHRFRWSWGRYRIERKWTVALSSFVWLYMGQ